MARTTALTSADFPSLGQDEHCTCCGRSLNHKRIAWLELDQRDDTYHARQDVPADMSQGWFPFGTACAKRVTAKAGASN